MSQTVQKVLAVVALCGLLYLLDDVRQYWSATVTTGVVSAIESRESCREGDSVKFCTHRTHVSVAYADLGVDRVSEVSFEPSETFLTDSRYHSIRVRPVVGLQVPVTLVNARPHLTRLAVYHRASRRVLWLECALLAALVWFAWNGKLPDRERQTA